MKKIQDIFTILKRSKKDPAEVLEDCSDNLDAQRLAKEPRGKGISIDQITKKIYE